MRQTTRPGGRGRVPRRLLLTGATGLSALLLACRDGGGSGSESNAGAAPSVSQEELQRGGVLVQRLHLDPPSLDPHTAGSYAGVWAAAPCFNQLLQFDPNKATTGPSDLLPDLAARLEQVDPTTVLFHLRPGVSFHDGAALSSEDVRVQLEWLANPPAGKSSPRRQALAVIEAVERPDDATVRLRLRRPAPSLLVNLASHHAGIGQARDIEANGGTGEGLIGTGPFKLKTHQRGTAVELERNPAYHVPGRPFLDGLRFAIQPDLPAAVATFGTGGYHLLFDLQLTAAEQTQLTSAPGSQVEAVLTPSTFHDLVTVNGRRFPYYDIRVRQAISLAIDRDAAIKAVKEGTARRGGYMSPKGAWAFPESDLRKVEGYDKPDTGKARQLLAAAAISTPLDATAPLRTELKGFGEFLKEQLSKIGIYLKLQPGDSATVQALLQRGEYDIAPFVAAPSLDDPDTVFADLCTSNAARNWTGLSDPEIDLLFEKQSQTFNLDERRRLVNELERRALNLHLHTCLFLEDLPTLRQRAVQNLVLQDSLYTNRRMEGVWLKP